MSERTVLLIEDETNLRVTLTEVLESHGYRVCSVATGEEGVEAASKKPFDIVVSDLRLPGISGIDVIRAVKSISSYTEGIVITGYATVETAVEAMRVGAFTYLQKPFTQEELCITLEKAFEHQSLKTENAFLKTEMSKGRRVESIVGLSPEIHRVREIIARIADSDSTVLLLGESGTGKELAAKALHYGSARSARPFVPINCAAIPEDLLESELFGYEKGAFTGAGATKIGRFEAANEGTVFLDEIGDMSPALQVKILRVLQEKEFERVGGRRSIKVDVRIIAATNQDLERAVDEKRFRGDLYYRLNVIPLRLPSLRERREDIQVLLRHFMDKVAGRKKKSLRGLSPEAVRLLEAYDWPGNVRELENLVERLVVLKEPDTLITPKDLPDRIRKRAREQHRSEEYIATMPEGIDFNAAVDNYERDLILDAMAKVKGVKKKAAEYLGINRTTLIEKMKRKGLLGPNEEHEETVRS
ncbi:MAG: sigma-54-dependent Fis family transcriptional regulator [Deltaproteobacteria bacterium]|nr:sigma-54-dependent Fis family transcriptional regulator [Deltaproteobacteria bacterium]